MCGAPPVEGLNINQILPPPNSRHPSPGGTAKGQKEQVEQAKLVMMIDDKTQLARAYP